MAKKRNIYLLGGALAGTINGLFGGGGGIPFVLLTTKCGTLEQKKALATCVAVIFPLCAVSAAVYFYRTDIPLAAALPYLVGGLFGGMAGRACNKRLDNRSAGRLFIGILFVIMAICIYNAIQYLT